MTATTNNQVHATGLATVGGRLPERPPLPGRWHALTVSLVATFMALLDTSIVNVALPSIERGLGASATSAQWVVSGYAFALGLALVPAGRLGDTQGRRRR
jgi:MFS family permease